MTQFCTRNALCRGRLSVVGAVMIAATLLTGCQKKPGGQVVAVVDGHEITLQDVQAQAAADNITTKEALGAARPRIVQQLVDRTVLADYARDNHLDRGPEYVARRRQMDETLLAYLAFRKLVGDLKSPTSAEAKSYVAANPLMFAQRERLNLDQIRFANPSDSRLIQDLTKLNSLDAIAANLRERGVKFTRAPASFDTGSVDKSLAEQIARLPDGEVFNLSFGDSTYFSQIKSRVPTVPNPTSWDARALDNLRRKILSDAISSKMGDLKKSTKIDYDPAYRPQGRKRSDQK